MKRAYPAFCPSGSRSFFSLSDGLCHYQKLGFEVFDAEDNTWAILRKGVFEAYLRRINMIEWSGTVVQLEEEYFVD